MANLDLFEVLVPTIHFTKPRPARVNKEKHKTTVEAIYFGELELSTPVIFGLKP